MGRARLGGELALVVLSLAATGCGASRETAARDVVVQFCGDVAAGRLEQARALLIAAERRDPAHQIQQEGLRAGYQVGEARADGDRMQVDVTSNGAPRPVVFVLLEEDGVWRIGLAASMHATLGQQLEHVRKVIDAAGKQMVERFQQTVQQNQPGAPMSGGR